MKKLYVLFAAILFCGTCYCMKKKEIKFIEKYDSELTTQISLMKECCTLLQKNKLKEAQQLATISRKKLSEINKSLHNEIEKSENNPTASLEYFETLQKIRKSNPNTLWLKFFASLKDLYAFKKHSFCPCAQLSLMKNCQKFIEKKKSQEAKKEASKIIDELKQKFKKIETSLSKEIEKQKNDLSTQLSLIKNCQKFLEEEKLQKAQNLTCSDELKQQFKKIETSLNEEIEKQKNDLTVGSKHLKFLQTIQKKNSSIFHEALSFPFSDAANFFSEKEKFRNQEKYILSMQKKNQKVEAKNEIKKHLKNLKEYNKKLDKMIKQKPPYLTFLKTQKENNEEIIQLYSTMLVTNKIQSLLTPTFCNIFKKIQEKSIFE